MKVVFLPEVENYLVELIETLYQRQYFSFKENATEYVIDLAQDIKKSLPRKSEKQAPSYFDRYGKRMSYAMFQKNKTTQWYVFFTKYSNEGKTIYLVRYIGNNHTVSQFL